MIQQKKKICVECGKLDYYFSRKRCKACSSKDYKKVNKVSDKQSEQNKILHSIYDAMETTEKKCFFCGCTNQPLDRMHLIRRSYSQSLIVHPLNIVFGCRECHLCFDEHPIGRESLPNYDKALVRIRLLDEEYYQRFI